jgi:hypothetical protein
MLSVSLYQRPSLRTDADVKTRFHRDRPDSVAVGSTDRGRRHSPTSTLHVLAAGEASGRSPLHDVKDDRAGNAGSRNLALGKSINSIRQLGAFVSALKERKAR